MLGARVSAIVLYEFIRIEIRGPSEVPWAVKIFLDYFREFLNKNNRCERLVNIEQICEEQSQSTRQYMKMKRKRE